MLQRTASLAMRPHRKNAIFAENLFTKFFLRLTVRTPRAVPAHPPEQQIPRNTPHSRHRAPLHVTSHCAAALARPGHRARTPVTLASPDTGTGAPNLNLSKTQYIPAPVGTHRSPSASGLGRCRPATCPLSRAAPLPGHTHTRELELIFGTPGG